MLLGCNKVWDYTADNYVHRLVQNKADGKLVQLDENGREVIENEILFKTIFSIFNMILDSAR